jgi:hypothetical protein
MQTIWTKNKNKQKMLSLVAEILNGYLRTKLMNKIRSMASCIVLLFYVDKK